MTHFRQAATHAAGGLGATVGPQIDAARMRADAAWMKADAARMRAYERTSAARNIVAPTAGRISDVASRGWNSTLVAVTPLAQAAKSGSTRAINLPAQKPARNNHMALYIILASGAVIGAAAALLARRRTRIVWSEYDPESLSAEASSFADGDASPKPSIKGHAKSAVDAIRHRMHGGTTESESMSDSMSEMYDEDGHKHSHAADRFDDRPEARNSAMPTGGSAMNTSAAATRNDRRNEDIDDMIRSSKNGNNQG